MGTLLAPGGEVSTVSVILYQFIVSVSKTIYTVTKFEWLYYICEKKEIVGNRKKTMGSGR